MKKSHLIASIKNGSLQAETVLAARNKALKRREAVLKKKAETGAVAKALSAKLVLAAGSPTQDVLLAEGDSWFDYPFHDVLKELEDGHGFDVESVAHKGDAIEEMAYGKGQLEDLTRLLEKLLRSNRVPKAILLSGGGNDVAGDEFAMMLNHSLSQARGLNKQVMEGVIGERLLLAYTFIIGAVTHVCKDKLGRPVKIIVHGYDYPVPDGRGFLGGWSFLPGPWLEPGFRAKGYGDLQERIDIVKGMIDRLNSMLLDLTALPQFKHVTYVDLRNTLSTGADYKKWWANELHPTEPGFRKVAEKIAAAI